VEEYIRKEKDKDRCVKIIIKCDEESKCKKQYKDDDKCCVEIIIKCDDESKDRIYKDDDKCCVKIIVNCDKDDERKDECKQVY